MKQNGDGGNGNDTPSQTNIFELNWKEKKTHTLKILTTTIAAATAAKQPLCTKIWIYDIIWKKSVKLGGLKKREDEQNYIRNLYLSAINMKNKLIGEWIWWEDRIKSQQNYIRSETKIKIIHLQEKKRKK